MNQTLPLKNVRDQLSDLISRVAYRNQKVVITKFGKPVAALVTFADYQKIMDPTKRFTKEEWGKGFKLFDKARENARQFPAEEIEQSINQSVSEVRKSKRV